MTPTGATSCRRAGVRGAAATQPTRWSRFQLDRKRYRRLPWAQCLQPSRLLVGLTLALALFQATRFEATSAKSIEIAPVNLATSDKTLAPDKLKSKLDALLVESSSPLLISTSKGEQITSTTSSAKTSTSTTTTTTTNQLIKETKALKEADREDDSAGSGDADYDVASGEGVSVGESAAREELSDLARLVKVQDELQAKVKEKLAGATRSSMELFEKLSLSGGCTSSLMNLMMGLSGIKSYAFKFIDASAKIPSGMMFGLLSDFGDFDQCLSIRSNPAVDPAHEAEEGSYSGKYCLLSIKLKYHVEAGPNGTAPEGIISDGVFWDDLIKNYWTSNATKGFQVGVCLPSRCNDDDLQQIFKLLAETNNFEGELTNCQDGNDLRRQHTPDLVQLIILDAFLSLLLLSIFATFLDRHLRLLPKGARNSLTIKLIICLSIRRNWRLFLQHSEQENRPPPVGQHHEMVESHGATITKRRPLLLRRQPVQSFISNTTGLTKVEVESDTERSRSNISEGEPASEVGSSSSQSCSSDSLGSLGADRVAMDINRIAANCYQQLSVKVSSDSEGDVDCDSVSKRGSATAACGSKLEDLLSHLSGLKLLVIVWITVGHSFLYPSANNYQYYRSIINMNITRDSVWFAATNFTLGIDMLLYMVGLIFVCKLADSAQEQINNKSAKNGARASDETKRVGLDIMGFLAHKILRFWPTYLAVIALAIVIPLVSDGPMWPEMVERRLGAACRQNWWANLLMVNNFMGAESICIPSSWFVSVMMQCLLIGSLVVFVQRKCSVRAAIALICGLIAGSSLISFAFAYQLSVRAPAIRMDESFVLEIDATIYRLYTSIFNNLSPFLVGMLGGFALVRWRQRQHIEQQQQWNSRERLASKSTANQNRSSSASLDTAASWLCEINLALAVGLVAVLVLSSVFHQHYTRFWAAVYWSCHRLGWALVTGYLVHQCATGRWRLLRDLLSLSSFRPLSKLIFIAYLLFPIFIHLHSGLVRDGLHVSIYNMLNIYITRLVMCFSTALALHLLVELPFRSIEQILLSKCQLLDIEKSPLTPLPRTLSCRQSQELLQLSKEAVNRVPLLAVAQSSDRQEADNMAEESSTKREQREQVIVD